MAVNTQGAASRSLTRATAICTGKPKAGSAESGGSAMVRLEIAPILAHNATPRGNTSRARTREKTRVRGVVVFLSSVWPSPLVVATSYTHAALSFLFRSERTPQAHNSGFVEGERGWCCHGVVAFFRSKRAATRTQVLADRNKVLANRRKRLGRASCENPSTLFNRWRERGLKRFL